MALRQRIHLCKGELITYFEHVGDVEGMEFGERFSLQLSFEINEILQE